MTAAWFLTKRTVTATAGQFQAFKENGVIDRVEIYQEAGNQDTGTPYIFNSTPSYTHYFDNDRQDEGSMPNRFVYDGRRQNSNATRLYLFHVREEKKDEAELKRSIESLTNESQEPGKGGNGTNGSLVLLKSVSSSDAKSSSKIQPANPISSQAGKNSQSSVLSYQIKTFDSSPINSSRETTDRKNVFDSVDSVSFVNQEKDTDGTLLNAYSYTSSSLSVFNNKASGDTTAKVQSFLAVVCHYNIPVIEYIYNINIGNDALNAETITFTSDWYFKRSS